MIASERVAAISLIASSALSSTRAMCTPGIARKHLLQQDAKDGRIFDHEDPIRPVWALRGFQSTIADYGIGHALILAI
jgi:hypothetical protein